MPDKGRTLPVVSGRTGRTGQDTPYMGVRMSGIGPSHPIADRPESGDSPNSGLRIAHLDRRHCCEEILREQQQGGCMSLPAVLVGWGSR